jgi:WD40 repeat protein
VDPGGELVAAAGGDSGSIFVWSIRTGRLLDEFPNHESAVVRVNFSPVSCRLLSCSWDGSTVITDFTDMEKVHREVLESPTDTLTAIWRPDGDQIATSNLAGKIGIWDPKSGRLDYEWDISRDIRVGRPKGVRVSAETLTDQGEVNYVLRGKM